MGVETEREGAVLLKRVHDLKPLELRQLVFEAQLLRQLELERVEVQGERVTRPWVEGPTLAELPLPLPSLEPFLNVLRMLEKAHAHGLLHLNLRPENLVLTERGLEPIDFLLPRFARLRGELRQLEPGAVHYLAPEVAGLIRAEVGPEADLYSVGALLHLALTGRPPYAAASAPEVLRAHLMAPLPDVSPLVRTLLARAPAERYRSAREARLALEDVLTGRAPRGARPPRLAAPAFVGRAEQLEELESQPGMHLVEGEAGSGKTRLLQELMLRAQSRGEWVLHSAATRAPSPLQLFAGLTREIARRADWELLRAELDVYSSVLAWAFPEWQDRLGAPGEGGLLAPGVLAAALARLIHKLGPAWLFLDDLHWADAVSLEALEKLLADPPPGVRIVGAGRPCQWFKGRPTRPLAPLADGPSRQLLLSMAPKLKEGRLVGLLELAAGSPLLLVEGLRGSWDRSELAADVLALRLEGFRGEGLRAAAVLGAGSAEVVSRVAGDVLPELEEARRAAILWRDAHGLYHFAHERLREKVLDGMEPEVRRQLHARAAGALEEAGAAALHWQAAGEPERAIPLALQAARESRARHDHATALEFYQLAGSSGYEVAECLRLAGRFQAALDCAARALATESSSLERARLLMVQGRSAARLDRLLEAEGCLKDALEQLRLPQTRLPGWKLLFPFAPDPRKGSEASSEVRLGLEIYQELMEVVHRNGRHPEVLRAVLTGLQLASHYPSLPESALLLSLAVPLQTYLGRWSSARETARRIRAISSRIDVYTRGRCLNRASAGNWSRAPLSIGLASVSEALSVNVLASTDLWEIGTARYVKGLFLIALGRLAEARSVGQEAVRLASELGNRLQLAMGLSIWAQASGGDVPADVLETELAQPATSFLQEMSLRVAAGLHAERNGDPRRAVDLLGEARTSHDAPQDAALFYRWQATFARRAAEESAPQYYRLARRAVRQALSAGLSFFYVTRLPALREAGLLAAARGHTARARKLLDEALAFALQCEARFEEAQTRQAWGRIGLPLGWPGAAEQLEAGRHGLRQLGATWLLEGETERQDPFETTLRWGRRLAAHPEQAPVALAELAGEGPQVERFLRSVAGAAQANAEREALQEHARRALRHQETELRALFAAAGVGLVVTDADGTVVEVNDTFREWVGPAWSGPARAGEWPLETAAGRRLLSRWTASGPRLYTVTLVEDLERVTAAQEASWKAREARLDRFRGALQRHEPLRLGALTAPFEVNLAALWDKLGVPVDVTSSLPERLPPLSGRTLRRLLQEALTNVRRHSRAGQVTIDLAAEAGWLSATVADDGVGFDPQEPSSRLGVRGMLWRARFAGGDCQIESAPGQGTTVRIRLPL